MGPPTAKLPSKRGKIDPIGTVVSQEEIVHLLLSFATPAPTMSSSSSSLKPYDESCLRLAIAESQKAVDAGCMPFGAALADADGKILAQACNASQARKTRGGGGDVTRHAEMELIRKACSEGGVDRETFETCTLYSSTEPCVMCAGAIYWAGVSRVVYGASVQEMEKVSGPGGFDIPIEKLYSMGREGTRKIECVGPILCEEAMKVHKESGVWAGSNGSQANADIEVERSLFTSGLGSAAAAKAGDYSVPVIDMSTGSDAEIAEQLWQAATTVGFFSLTGHGIPQSDIDAAFGASAAFFAQSQSEKDAQSPFSRNNNAGYEYMSQVRPSTGTADQKESLQMTFRDGAMDGRWPSEPENFRSVAEGLAAKCHELAGRLMDLLESRACPNLKPGTLSKSHNLWAPDGQCTLRMLHYTPMTAETAKQLTTPDENGRIHWRAGAHTDWDCVTLLFQRVGQAGLECMANPRVASTEGARWTPIDPVEGGIAVNIGDMLARWSSGRLYSNLHRVRMPTPEECTPPSSRYSIAFFAQADKSALIETDGVHEPITAGDYILSRIQSNFEK